MIGGGVLLYEAQVPLVSSSVTGGALAVVSVGPSSGLTTGGTKVVLKGQHLSPNSTVTFGNAKAKVVSTNADSMTVVTPAHTAGKVDIKIIADGKSKIVNTYTYK